MTPEEDDINRQPVVLVEISSLRLDGSVRLAGADPDHLAALIAAPGELPPILIHRPTGQVIDGTHRVHAALRRGETVIAGRYYDGSEDQAYVLSVWLNTRHGLPLALVDRKRAVERIAASNPRWSDRRVAAVTGMSPGTVAEIRSQLAGPTEPGARRIGQDGRVRPLDCSDGRRLAGQLMSENPNLSLRQVAKAAAISPETARDVRNRLLNGDDVVPNRRGRKSAGPAARTAAAERRSLNLLADNDTSERAVTDQIAIVNRLTGDPSLRYTETGRNLLRLLTLHARWTKEWDSIVDHVPPHCTDVVANLAREFADQWSDLATRVRNGRRIAS